MKKILNMAMVLCLLASLLLMTSCENALAESSVHKNEKVSALDFTINTKMGVRYGERCAMFTYQNNSAYKLTDFTLTLKPKDNLTETEIEELYALIQKEYRASDSEMEMVKQYGIDVLSIEMWCYDDVLAGAESESEEIEGPFGDLESLDQLNYFEEDILEFTYVDENGDTNTVYYDYINKTYTHD